MELIAQRISGKANANGEWEIEPMPGTLRADQWKPLVDDSTGNVWVRLRPQDHFDSLGYPHVSTMVEGTTMGTGRYDHLIKEIQETGQVALPYGKRLVRGIDGNPISKSLTHTFSWAPVMIRTERAVNLLDRFNMLIEECLPPDAEPESIEEKKARAAALAAEIAEDEKQQAAEPGKPRKRKRE